ncbi:MAG TPA: hypothetical protein VIM92_09715 [Rhodanobacteraceae bacterium]
MSVETEERPAAAEPGAARPAADAPAGAVLAAGIDLFASLKRTIAALLALMSAEVQVFGASVGLIFLSSVALVAFAVALWVCVVALIGWALAVATHSVGIALAILVGIHLLLVAGIWIAIRRAIRQITFPRTRAELSVLRRTLRRDVARFQHASPVPPGQEES